MSNTYLSTNAVDVDFHFVVVDSSGASLSFHTDDINEAVNSIQELAEILPNERLTLKAFVNEHCATKEGVAISSDTMVLITWRDGEWHRTDFTRSNVEKIREVLAFKRKCSKLDELFSAVRGHCETEYQFRLALHRYAQTNANWVW